MANVWPPFNNITSVATANATVNSTTEVVVAGTSIELVPKVDCVVTLIARVFGQETTPITARASTVDNLRCVIQRASPSAAALSFFDVRPAGGEQWRGSAEFSTKDSMLAGVTYTYHIRCSVSSTRATATYVVLSTVSANAMVATRLSAWGLPADGQTY